jgi:DNA-binding beta-propeller fold protein YncE
MTFHQSRCPKRKLLGVVVCVLTVAAVQAADVYRLEKEIAIGGQGGWDYLLVDPAAHRLYVSHATKIVVADTETGDVVGEIPNLAGVHGIALAPELGRGFTSDGRSNTSTIIDLKTLKPLGTVATGANPDSIRYSPSRKEVWAFNHTGESVTVFEAETGRIIATIKVGGVLEEAVEDAPAHRMFVNIEDKGEAHPGRHVADRRLRGTNGARLRCRASPAAQRVRREDGRDRQHLG